MNEDFIKGTEHALELIANYNDYLRDNAGDGLLDRLILEIQTEVLECAIANATTTIKNEL